jgi:hypothetical protein
LRQFDQEGKCIDVGAEPPQQPRRCGRGASRREQIIDNQNAVSLTDGIRVNFQRIGAVFQRVLFAKLLMRQLAGLAHGDEPGADCVRDRRSENVSACLDTDDVVDSAPDKPCLSFNNGVMSRKRIPGIGKSGIARIRVSISTGDRVNVGGSNGLQKG